MGVVIRLAFKEILSKRLLHLALMLTAIFIIIYAVGEHYFVRDMFTHRSGWNNTEMAWYRQQLGFQFLVLGWYISSLLAGAVMVFIGSSSISREIESGTMLGLASKPLSRRSIILGKFLAYAIMGALYAILLSLAIILVNNYYFSINLPPIQILKGMGIFALLPLSLLAPALLGSTLLSSLANGVAMFLILCLGIIGGFMEQIGAMMKVTNLVNIGIISSLISPCDAVYRLAISRVGGEVGSGIIATFGPFGSASTPSVWMLVYVLIYIAVMLWLAARCFQKRDL